MPPPGAAGGKPGGRAALFEDPADGGQADQAGPVGGASGARLEVRLEFHVVLDGVEAGDLGRALGNVRGADRNLVEVPADDLGQERESGDRHRRLLRDALLLDLRSGLVLGEGLGTEVEPDEEYEDGDEPDQRLAATPALRWLVLVQANRLLVLSLIRCGGCGPAGELGSGKFAQADDLNLGGVTIRHIQELAVRRKREFPRRKPAGDVSEQRLRAG